MATATSMQDRPALLGGPLAVDLDQEHANQWPLITGQEERAVLDVLRSGLLSINEVVGQLEQDYCRWLGAGHAVAHCNGTSAILAAFNVIPIGSRSDWVPARDAPPPEQEARA